MVVLGFLDAKSLSADPASDVALPATTAHTYCSGQQRYFLLRHHSA